MKRTVVLSAIVAMSLSLDGCEKKDTETQTKTTVTRPDGSTTTTTDTHKVETKGETVPGAR